MINDYIKIKVYSCSLYFINYLLSNHIYYYDLEKFNDYYLLNIHYNDLVKINKLYRTDIIKYYGIKCIWIFIKRNIHVLVGLLIGLLLFINLENTIFSVEINTTDDEIYNIVNSSLKKYDIEKYKKKKTFQKLEMIKEEILKENKNLIEWMSIIEKGCTYEVEVIKKISSGNKEKNHPSNIVASKDGLIKYIVSSSGIKMVDKNDYVKKGDVLISGIIVKNDKVVDEVSSKGKVFAEVWYTSKIYIPYKYMVYEETGKVINHYYIEVFGKKITIAGKYESNNTFNKTTTIISKPYLFFKLYKENKKVFKYSDYKLNESEAYNEAIKRAETEIKKNLGNEEYIISKNVLKKKSFSSKIYVEVFFKIYENIGYTSLLGS